jgi:hypothetical protein
MKKNVHELPKVPSTLNRYTPDSVNEEIERQIEATVGYYKKQDEKVIKERILQLEHEWDAERVLLLSMGSIMLAGSALSLGKNKKWGAAAVAAAALLIQMPITGWNPALAALRRVPVRTNYEIDLEKKALMNLLDNPS